MFFAYSEEVDEGRGVVVYSPKYLYFSCDFFIQMREKDPETSGFYRAAFELVKPPTVEFELPQLKNWEGSELDQFGEEYPCRILEVT